MPGTIRFLIIFTEPYERPGAWSSSIHPRAAPCAEFDCVNVRWRRSHMKKSRSNTASSADLPMVSHRHGGYAMTSLRRILIETCVAIAPLYWAGGAFAENSTDRAGHWEGSFQVLYGDSKTVDSDNGSSAEVDNSFGWGLGFGYNFDDHWAIEFNGSWREADYKATITPQAGNPNGPQSISGTLETGTLAVNATYNFLPRALTPFVTGGVGGTYVDTT